MPVINKYHWETETTGTLLDRIALAEDSGIITSSLATALMVAAYQQCILNLKAIREVYNNGEDNVRQLLVDLGVIQITIEQDIKDDE